MATETAQGTLDLKVDEQDLSAVLLFSSDPKGSEISKETLNTFIQSKGLKFGLKQDALAKALTFFAAVPEGERSEIEVAVGLQPVPPEPGLFEWEELPVPEELSYEAARLLETASSPEIYSTRIEKLKKTRRVLKKSKIPFVAPKEITEEYVEKQERRERVYVDPTVVATGWVEAGSLIGRYKPGKPGKPGKDVFARTIAPDAAEAPFYCGTGVESRKSEFVAVETGFFRRGDNWIEVMAHSHHQWEVRLSEDHHTCFFDFNPGSPDSVPPAAEDVSTAAVELGYPAVKLISSTEIQQIIAEALRSGCPLEGTVISVDEDSHFEVHSTEDKLKAFLSIRKHRGAGKPLLLKQVGAAITAAGFKGLDRDAVRTVILDFYKSPETELKDHLLLEGKPAVAGEDEEFSLKVTFMAEQDMSAIRERAEMLKESGELSLESWQVFPGDSITKMAMVKSDQLIGEIITGRAGESGTDVFGARIEPGLGRKAPIKTFEGIRIEKGLIVAEIDGVLECGEIDGVTMLRLHPHQSARASVRLSEDRMAAFLSVTAPEGTGFPVNEAALREAVVKAGVSRGIDEEALGRLGQRAADGEEIESEAVAAGQPPKDVGKVEVTYKIDFATGKGVTIAGDGHADFRRQDKITSVQEGQLIAEVFIPPGDSEPGWDVTGKTLTARELKQIPLEAGSNIEARTEDEGMTRFYAATAGELVRENNRLEVRNVYAVAGDVDMKSGNIKFSGSVQIKGSVEAGFVVFSGADIQVGGTVDGALLSAEGSIFIGAGVKGAGKAVLRSKNNIVASFIEQAQVMAVGDIRVKNSCLRNTIRCNGRLQLVSEKGNLIGGELKSRRGAEVQNIGHPNGIPTQIFFGQDYLIADRIQVEEREIAKTRDNITRIETMLQRLEKAGEQTKLARARQEKLKFLKLIEKRSLRLFTLREKYEEHYPSEVVVRGTLYPGVIFESHGRYYEVDAPQKGVVVFFNSEVGKIQDRPIGENKEQEE